MRPKNSFIPSPSRTEKKETEALPYLDRALESNSAYTGAWHDKAGALTRAEALKRLDRAPGRAKAIKLREESEGKGARRRT